MAAAPAALPASDAVLYQRTYFTPVLQAYLLGLLVAFGVSRAACFLPDCLTAVDWCEGHWAAHACHPVCVSLLAAAATALLPLVPRCLQVNAVTHLGQPALLYLCPLTLGSVALVAATRGDLGKIWAFTDTTLVTSPPGSSKEKKEQERHAAAAAEAAAEKERGQ